MSLIKQSFANAYVLAAMSLVPATSSAADQTSLTSVLYKKFAIKQIYLGMKMSDVKHQWPKLEIFPLTGTSKTLGRIIFKDNDFTTNINLHFTIDKTLNEISYETRGNPSGKKYCNSLKNDAIKRYGVPHHTSSSDTEYAYGFNLNWNYVSADPKFRGYHLTVNVNGACRPKQDGFTVFNITVGSMEIPYLEKKRKEYEVRKREKIFEKNLKDPGSHPNF